MLKIMKRNLLPDKSAIVYRIKIFFPQCAVTRITPLSNLLFILKVASSYLFESLTNFDFFTKSNLIIHLFSFDIDFDSLICFFFLFA